MIRQNPVHHLISTPLDFTKTIDAILHRQPGPVKFFGVDRSACPGPKLLADWIDVLSEKNVECLRFMNISKAQELEFPLHRLRGDGTLKSLAIAFFSISRPLRLTLDEYLEATFGVLSNLTLGCCALDGQALASLIFDCHVLTTVKIVGSNLTAGRGARGLRIISNSMNRLELHQCSVTTALTLDMPALQFLTLQVNPGMDSERPGVNIHLDSSEYLRELTSLMLDRQRFSFSSNSYVMFEGRMMDSLPYMQTLSLGIDMGNADQSRALIGLLNRTPKLLRLNVWRTDTPSDDEGEPWTMDEDPLLCRCVANYLDRLTVTNYRGGKAEQEFVKAVLRRGCKLTRVTVNSHKTLPQHIRKANYHLLINSQRASAVCSINVF